jgi:hypothetical protein
MPKQAKECPHLSTDVESMPCVRERCALNVKLEPATNVCSYKLIAIALQSIAKALSKQEIEEALETVEPPKIPIQEEDKEDKEEE